MFASCINYTVAVVELVSSTVDLVVYRQSLELTCLHAVPELLWLSFVTAIDEGRRFARIRGFSSCAGLEKIIFSKRRFKLCKNAKILKFLKFDLENRRQEH